MDLSCSRIFQQFMQHWMTFLRLCCSLCASVCAYSKMYQSAFAYLLGMHYMRQEWPENTQITPGMHLYSFIFHVGLCWEKWKKIISNSCTAKVSVAGQNPYHLPSLGETMPLAFTHSYSLHILHIHCVRRGAVAINTCAETFIRPNQHSYHTIWLYSGVIFWQWW